ECADFAIVALATTAESVLDIRFSFDVGRSMFDVRRSSFKTIPYGVNVTCERKRRGRNDIKRDFWMDTT
ncbi:MAG: hypothetical protein JW883_11025, partial [Deltaproteobacteria bacterium]|nr:hypothetical protein [Deltaproteobacteria bacterium]